MTNPNGGWSPPPNGGGWGQPPQPGSQQGGWGQPPQPGPYQQPYGAPPGNPYAIAAQPGYGPMSQAPSSYKNIGIMMLISGIKGALFSVILILSLIWVCVGIFWFVTLAGSIVEIVFGAMIMSGKPVRSARAISILGIINGTLCGNLIGVGLEAVALSQMSRPEVEHYLAYAPPQR